MERHTHIPVNRTPPSRPTAAGLVFAEFLTAIEGGEDREPRRLVDPVAGERPVTPVTGTGRYD